MTTVRQGTEEDAKWKNKASANRQRLKQRACDGAAEHHLPPRIRRRLLIIVAGTAEDKANGDEPTNVFITALQAGWRVLTGCLVEWLWAAEYSVWIPPAALGRRSSPSR